jgi:hypothetical protein
MNTSETKKCVKIFCEAFLISKKYFASTIQDLFYFLQKKLFKFPSSEYKGYNCSFSGTVSVFENVNKSMSGYFILICMYTILANDAEDFPLFT